MTDFRLKDCQEIKIRTVSSTDELPVSLGDADDVERIRILNDIVWEKNKNTVTQLTINNSESKYNVLYNDSFTLTTSTVLKNQNPNNTSTIINGTINFYKDNVLIGTKSTVNGTAQLTIKGDKVGSSTYKAIFSGKGYKDSSASIDVDVKKRASLLSFVGTSTVYKTWKIGIKLTSNQIPLIGKKVNITINGITYTKTTDANGIARLQNNLPAGQYVVDFMFNEDDTYESSSNQRTYIMKDYLEKTLSVVDVGGLEGGKYPPYQRWDKISDTEYHCYKNNKICYQNTDTIGIVTYNTPHPLTIGFGCDTIKIYAVNLSFTARQSAGCTGSHYGAYFSTPPTISIGFIEDTEYSSPVDGTAFPPLAYTWKGKTHHYSKGPVNNDITWTYDNGKLNWDRVSVKIEYPSNSGSEEGYLVLTNVKLKISYIPEQGNLV